MRMTAIVLPLVLCLSGAALAQSRTPVAAPPPPPTPADGGWRGQSNPGSCGQPMEMQLSIDRGLAEGTGRETSGKTALLWTYHGRARADGTVELFGHASAFPPQNARQARLTGRIDGGRLVIIEAGGCGRQATLAKG